MGKIQILPGVLASQVAAGEVVERPASVIKELIENSLDAGATRISVLVRRGGSALLKIVDDGSGMSREDAMMCLERHATSKLRTSEDLSCILTKGFRGEALPSIASVSKFTLSTRGHGALTGTRITVEGGQVLEVMDDGGAPGTTVEVRQLFYNVPARRKFLRSEDTEFSHIEQQVRVQALAHPETGFSLTRDDRLIFHLAPGDSLMGRIAGLTGPELTDRLLEIPRTTRGPLSVSGYLGEPGLWRSNRTLQFCFLNRRPVESVAFGQALRSGYGEALPRGQAAVAFLMMEIDPAEVDVNVHPAKKEVRFRNSLAVQSALGEIISLTLSRGRLISSGSSQPATPQAPVAVPRWVPPQIQPPLIPPREVAALRNVWEGVAFRPAPPSSPTPSQPGPALPPPAQAPAPAEEPASPAAQENLAGFQRPELRNAPHSAAAAAAEEEEVNGETALQAVGFRPVGLLGTAYILLESHEGLVLLDHRAAWERILYEEAQERARNQSAVSQSLLSPLTISLSPREYDFLKPQLSALRRMGLGIEEFGSNTVLIDSLPPFLKADGEMPALLSALLEDLRHSNERSPLRRLDDSAIAAAVARQAARRQPPQTLESAVSLTARLMACAMPYCRPDGSPVLLQFSWQELARKFSRPNP